VANAKAAVLTAIHHHRTRCYPTPAMVPFYLSTWEEYHTGVLYLGYFNGPTEGILLGQILMLLTALYGTPTGYCHLGRRN